MPSTKVNPSTPKTERANISFYNAKKGRPRGLPLLSSSARLGAVHRSAAPWPPTGWPRSTLGAMGLSFRVRNGTGRAPHALAADRWAAPTVTVSGCLVYVPWGPHGA